MTGRVVLGIGEVLPRERGVEAKIPWGYTHTLVALLVLPSVFTDSFSPRTELIDIQT